MFSVHYRWSSSVYHLSTNTMFCKSVSLLSAYYLHLYLSLVSAHGFVTFISVDGVLYYGANGVNASSDSPMRKVASNFPVTNVSSTDLICGLDASPASTIVNVQKGSLIQFIWGSISGTNWFHQTGQSSRIEPSSNVDKCIHCLL